MEEIRRTKMMKKQLYISLIVIQTLGLTSLCAQLSIHNFGNIQMHDQAVLGFHMDFINDGVFDQNLGLAGFYGYDKSITVSGMNEPVFYDTEILVDNSLYLDTGIGVINNGNLITGDIITPRFDSNIFTNFIDEAFYIGENDISLVDGYAAITNKESFTFPVGDDERLRPLTINSSAINPLAKCAYFFESPNTPSTFGKSYQTEMKASDFLTITEKEFWHLEGDLPSNVTLTWDERSDIGSFTNFSEDIKVVGWHSDDQMWVNLGNTEFQGTISTGSVTSQIFVPNEYEIITLGSIDKLSNEFTTIQLDNYFISANNDGKNDFLVLDGIEVSPNNELKIFNRYGVLVYSKMNYQNEFKGISNRNVVINRGSGLASGVYFYIVTLLDVRQRHQGYLYLSSTE